MALKIVIKPLALLEIDDAVLYYEDQIKGLSKRFLFELDDCINRISAQPDNYLIISFPLRRILLKNFLTNFHYFVAGNYEVVIIALIHTKAVTSLLERE